MYTEQAPSLQSRSRGSTPHFSHLSLPTFWWTERFSSCKFSPSLNLHEEKSSTNSQMPHSLLFECRRLHKSIWSRPERQKRHVFYVCNNPNFRTKTHDDDLYVKSREMTVYHSDGISILYFESKDLQPFSLILEKAKQKQSPPTQMLDRSPLTDQRRRELVFQT